MAFKKINLKWSFIEKILYSIAGNVLSELGIKYTFLQLGMEYKPC